MYMYTRMENSSVCRVTWIPYGLFHLEKKKVRNETRKENRCVVVYTESIALTNPQRHHEGNNRDRRYHTRELGENYTKLSEQAENTRSAKVEKRKESC